MMGFRQCTNCHFYDEMYKPDILNSDKTVTKGELMFRVCEKMESELSDLTPCELWQRDTHDRYYRKTAAGRYLVKQILPMIKNKDH